MTAARNDENNCVRDPEIVRAETDIARARETVAVSVMALQREISRSLDWREWVRQKPLLSVALAFGVGALLGTWAHDFHGRHK
jgi:ElaB/YqjD/DUF883 family membrane-anchored ribosome-binding protein